MAKLASVRYDAHQLLVAARLMLESAAFNLAIRMSARATP
jgi:hypothetical protein